MAYAELDATTKQVVAGIKEGEENFEQFIIDNIPPGRRRAIALTKLEELSMWATKAATRGDA